MPVYTVQPHIDALLKSNDATAALTSLNLDPLSIKGDTGPEGPQGIRGATGQGLPGPTGPTGPAGPTTIGVGIIQTPIDVTEEPVNPSPAWITVNLNSNPQAGLESSIYLESRLLSVTSQTTLQLRIKVIGNTYSSTLNGIGNMRIEVPVGCTINQLVDYINDDTLLNPILKATNGYSFEHQSTGIGIVNTTSYETIPIYINWQQYARIGTAGTMGEIRRVVSAPGKPLYQCIKDTSPYEWILLTSNLFVSDITGIRYTFLDNIRDHYLRITEVVVDPLESSMPLIYEIRIGRPRVGQTITIKSLVDIVVRIGMMVAMDPVTYNYPYTPELDTGERLGASRELFAGMPLTLLCVDDTGPGTFTLIQ